MARDPGLNTITTAATVLAGQVGVAAPYDVLAVPGNDDLVSAGLSLWPKGSAWGSPDGEGISLASVLAKLTRVLVDPFVWLYARAFRLARESSVSGVDELLVEWEADFGLPDECLGNGGTVSERLRALEAKVAAVAISRPGDFIRLAASYGFEITIEEPAIFECGFSECGGDHSVGAASDETYWIVRVTGLAVDYFTCGESECGYTPLFSLGEGERLLCLMRKFAPAWTIPVLYDAV